ncbi:MaoC family dehydratase N-terminal domain-containing protein [Nocardia sp. NBC_01499]|uniref:FAS1-like dehydratase domain-containing protein n=1 Tax=Nocardia sp. NBC_01499 TaxID=2903597 RepID=UPI003866FD99
MEPSEQVSALVDRRWTAPYDVLPGKIREFARAVQDYHPAHWSEGAAADLGFAGLLAPAAFASTILGRIQQEMVDALTEAQRTRILHVDHVLDFGGPVIAGDRLSCAISVESFRHFADYDVLAIRSMVTDQRGTVVQTGATTLLARIGRGDPRLIDTNVVRGFSPSPDTIGAHRVSPPNMTRIGCTAVDFETLEIGTELPARTVQLSRGDLMTYARVVEGTIPDSVDTAARGRTRVAPGMLKLGMASAFASSWLGDPMAITTFRAQFGHYTHYLRVPPLAMSALEFRGRVTALDPRRRRATVVIDARANGRKLFGYAAAEVRFPLAD